MAISEKSSAEWNFDAMQEQGFRLVPTKAGRSGEAEMATAKQEGSILSVSPAQSYPELWQALTRVLRDQTNLAGHTFLEIPGATPSKGARLFDSEKLASHQHLFLGHDAWSGSPVLLSRQVLSEHAHIMGSTGSGKTAKGVIPILEQLIHFRDAAFVIIDLKGDMALFQAARQAADRIRKEKAREVGAVDLDDVPRNFKWFTTEVGRSTFAFNPFLQDKQGRFLSVKQKAESFTEALGLDHGDGYGVSFFSRVNRSCLGEIFNARALAGTPITSLFQLKAILEDKLKGRARQDAFELISAVDLLASIDQLNVNEDPKKGETPEQARARVGMMEHSIKMSEVISEHQIVYFNLPQAIEGSCAREIGRFVINALFQSCYHAHRMEKQVSKHPRAYLIIDEFQNVVGKSFTAILEQARSMGLAVILSHQHLAQLRKRQNEDYRDIIKGTRFKHFFSAELGSETHEYLLRASGEAEGFERAPALGPFVKRSEYRIPTNDIIELSDNPELSIVHVRTGHGFSQFKGYPFIVRSGFHVGEDEWRRRQRAEWPESKEGTGTMECLAISPLLRAKRQEPARRRVEKVGKKSKIGKKQ